MSSELNREISFALKGNQYSMKFPTIGEFMEIESRRMQLSNGTYTHMLRSNLTSSVIAMDMIDMAATISVLAPKVVKDLKSSSLLDLDIFDGNELLGVYKNIISPWVEGWMKLMKDASKTEEEKEKSTENVG